MNYMEYETGRRSPIIDAGRGFPRVDWWVVGTCVALGTALGMMVGVVLWVVCLA